MTTSTGKRPKLRLLSHNFYVDPIATIVAQPAGARKIALPPSARAQSGRLVSRGARRPSPRRARRTSRSSSRSATRPATGATSWSTNRSSRRPSPRFLNEHFVSIKVDREERPDVDQVYMTFVQATTGHGGWPMSVWLTPELRPFTGGTYFPPTDVPGRPGFITVLRRIAELWKTDRAADRGQGPLAARPPCARRKPKSSRRIRRRWDARQDGAARTLPIHPDVRPAARAASAARRNFRARSISSSSFTSPRDKESDAAGRRHRARHGALHPAQDGGRRHARSPRRRLSSLLGRCASGTCPHFEKMLYDQAQLAQVYLTAHQISGDDRFSPKSPATSCKYVGHDLTSPDGGFYSAEDADSLPKKDSPRKRPRARSMSGRTTKFAKSWARIALEEFRATYGVEAERQCLRRLPIRTASWKA